MFTQIPLFICISLIVLSVCHAQELVISSDDGPPHMIQKTDEGIDIEIAREVLQELGYSVTIRYSSLARGKLDVERGHVDAVTPTFFEKDRPGFYVSSPTVTYKPTVFTLKSSHHKINNILGLAGHNIITFQGATGYFGPDFIEVSKNSEYRESYSMEKFPELLLRGRYSAVVLDYYIFNYFYRIDDKNRDTSIFQAHPIIPPVKASVGFHDKNIRDQFNQKLSEYLNQKKDVRVIEKYIGK